MVPKPEASQTFFLLVQALRACLRETPVARIDSAIKLRDKQLAHKLDVRRTQGETAGAKASTEDGLNTMFMFTK